MSEENNHIDEVIRQKLDGFEMTPPADVWAKTEALIVPVSRSRRTWLFLLGGLLLVGLTVTGIMIYTGNENVGNQLAQNDLTSPQHTSTDQSKSENSSSSKNSSSKNSSSENSSPESLSSKNSTSESSTSKNSSDTNTTSTSNTSESDTESNQTNLNQGGILNVGVASHLKIAASPGWFDAYNYVHGTSIQYVSSDQLSKNLASSGFNGNYRPSGSQAFPIDDKLIDDKLVDDKLDTDITLISDKTKLDDPLTPAKSDDSKPLIKESYSPILMSIMDLKKIKGGPDRSLEDKKLGDITPGKKPSRFSIDFSAGISTFQMRTKDTSASPALGALLKTAPNKRLGLDFDLGVNYVLWKKLSLHTGVQYSKLNEQLELNSPITTTYTYLDTTGVIWDSVAMDSVYVIVPISYEDTVNISINESNSYQLMSIPFGVSWRARLSTRSNLEMYLGGAINIYSKHVGQAISDESGNLILASDAYKKSGQLSISASVRYIYQLNEKHAVYVEPWFKSGISLFNTTSLTYKSRMYRTGVKLGYRFYF
ncbi:MAG: hypothetical protein ACI837_002646 [Crocinitomicaceae bacterium]|jgi:hypothetical protein